MPTIPVQTRLAPPAPAAATVSLAPPRPPASATASGLSPQVSALPSAGSVSLRIDALVLHGFPAAEARRTGAAFEKELSRLLTESPLSESTLNPSLPHSLPSSPSSSSSSGAARINHWSLYIGRSGALGAGAARALHARLRA